MTFAHCILLSRHLTKELKNDRSIENNPSTCATITELLDEVLEEESSNIEDLLSLQEGCKYSQLEALWHFAVAETFAFSNIFVHSPAHGCVPNVDFRYSGRSVTFECTGSSRHAFKAMVPAPLDFFITADVETSFDACRV